MLPCSWRRAPGASGRDRGNMSKGGAPTAALKMSGPVAPSRAFAAQVPLSFVDQLQERLHLSLRLFVEAPIPFFFPQHRPEVSLHGKAGPPADEGLSAWQATLLPSAVAEGHLPSQPGASYFQMLHHCCPHLHQGVVSSARRNLITFWGIRRHSGVIVEFPASQLAGGHRGCNGPACPRSPGAVSCPPFPRGQ